MMQEIGGYFELELRKAKAFHEKGIPLNSGRNALAYILKANLVSKLYVPSYICNAVIDTIRRFNIEFEYYGLNKNLEINKDIDVKETEKILYANYFGIKDKYISVIIGEYQKSSLIIDNAQSFFSYPISGVDTFYSPRKFFGVPDGGYAYCNVLLGSRIPRGYSYDRCRHLVGRIDKNAERFYSEFRDNEETLSRLRMERMSRLTRKILSSIDYEFVKQRRLSNFLYLHNELGEENMLKFQASDISSPMVYPFFVATDNLKRKLIKNRVYVASYWDDVMERVPKDSFEGMLTKYLVPIPIDQRYGISEMDNILKIINKN